MFSTLDQQTHIPIHRCVVLHHLNSPEISSTPHRMELCQLLAVTERTSHLTMA